MGSEMCIRDRFNQPVDAANQGGLAGSRWTNQGKHLSSWNAQIYFLESMVAGTVAFAQFLQFKHEKSAKGSAPKGADRDKLLAGVGNVIGFVDRTDHSPMLFVGNWQKLTFVGLLKFTF